MRNINTGRYIKVCFLTKKSKCFTKRVILKLSHSVLSPSDEVRNYPAHWRMKNQPNPINGSVWVGRVSKCVYTGKLRVKQDERISKIDKFFIENL